ncbi:MAG: hypothetical protein R3C10_05400 [Pirellulales bacterium]
MGFCPTRRSPSPLVPLAVGRDAWHEARCGDGNHNGIAERELRLAISAGQNKSQAKSNSQLVAFDHSSSSMELCRTQLLTGVAPEDLADSRGELGPATEQMPLSLTAVKIPNATAAQALAECFNEVAASHDPRRAFCLYGSAQPGNGQVSVVGFVAAVVVGAEVDDDQLVVTVEPCYLIHPTLWTAGLDSPPQPEPNLYLHKLRLTR